MSTLKFSTTQLQHIEMGRIARAGLTDAVAEACNVDLTSLRPHHYFQSIAGYGKSHAIKEGLEKAGADYHIVSGNVSIHAFGFSLAFLYYQKAVMNDTSPTIIVVDDCDSILAKGTVNIIKQIVESERKYVYNKNVNSYYKSLSPIQQKAIDYCSSDISLGFTVDCSNMIFLFASNRPLPTKQQVEASMHKSSHEYMQHLHAIRSRCHYRSFSYDWERMWGWIADVILTTDAAGCNLSEDQKMIILDWMYNKWTVMNETSIRTVQKMAEIMVKKPDTYKDEWELTYLTEQ
jgi:hypothetical protein